MSSGRYSVPNIRANNAQENNGSVDWSLRPAIGRRGNMQRRWKYRWIMAILATLSATPNAQAGEMQLPDIRTQPTPQAVLDEHLDALNKCDWNRLAWISTEPNSPNLTPARLHILWAFSPCSVMLNGALIAFLRGVTWPHVFTFRGISAFLLAK
jgi:hypothetical protein